MNGQHLPEGPSREALLDALAQLGAAFSNLVRRHGGNPFDSASYRHALALLGADAGIMRPIEARR